MSVLLYHYYYSSVLLILSILLGVEVGDKAVVIFAVVYHVDCQLNYSMAIISLPKGDHSHDNERNIKLCLGIYHGGGVEDSPSRLRCPRLWLRTIAGKSTCGGSVAFPWEDHPKGGNYDGV